MVLGGTVERVFGEEIKENCGVDSWYYKVNDSRFTQSDAIN